nr:MAG TPA: hypothetical protein [Caudoviricetes sp.]
MLQAKFISSSSDILLIFDKMFSLFILFCPFYNAFVFTIDL